MKIHRPKNLNKHATPDELLAKWEEWSRWGRRMRARMAGRKAQMLFRQQGRAEQIQRNITESSRLKRAARKRQRQSQLCDNRNRSDPTKSTWKERMGRAKLAEWVVRITFALPKEVRDELLRHGGQRHGAVSEQIRNAIYVWLRRR